MATFITHDGFTVTFDDDVEVGAFCNGDPWCVGPVNIIGISPGSVIESGRTKNGSMINPGAAGDASHGFDSSASGYSASLNAGRPGGNPVSESNPLAFPAGSSLLCSWSLDAPAGPNLVTVLRRAAVFTCLASAPASGSFRPPYSGSDKSIIANETDIDYGRLASLTPVGTWNLSSLAGSFLRPWIEVRTNFAGRYIHPSENQPEYGREMANLTANAGLALQWNYTNEQKRDLLVRYIQYGIDIYGAARIGAQWNADGGHNVGRKLPLVIAANVLGNTDMLTYCAGSSYRIFQEDQQAFYVEQADVDNTTVGNNKAVASMTASGTLATVTTESAHGIPAGSGASASVVRIAGASPSQYNGHWSVPDGGIVSSTVFRLTVSPAPGGAATDVGTVTHMNNWRPDRRNSLVPYSESDIGLPEWGLRNASDKQKNNRAWDAEYRGVATPPWPNTALAVHVMGVRAAWAWPAFFDYVDRQVSINGASAQWTAYRSLGGPAWPDNAAVAPAFTQSPASQSVNEGSDATFIALASGAPLPSYQWRKAGVPLSDGGRISGSTTAALTIASTESSDSGQYDCVATNASGSATSAPASLTVNVTPPPDPDESFVLRPKRRRNAPSVLAMRYQ